MSRLLPRRVFGALTIALLGASCASAPQATPEQTAPVQVVSTPYAPQVTWDRTIERAIPCIVNLHVTRSRALDTEGVGSGQGTGFVVDKERGIILTNRHLVTPNPVSVHAVFYNQEEVELEEVYYDVVHDFGFYRFDPSAVEFAELCELTLAPDDARVGTEIRVIGNDAGEKISILQGTLAKLDRNAPNYGRGKYNDFNTFYYQAASNTSGGSSGSPVLDVSGHVVALNAGGSRRAASSFYLPLHPVVRALESIQRGAPVARGTLQTVFRHEPFYELARLGLSDETQREVRSRVPAASGMLRVETVIPEGPAEGKLRKGDVLIAVEGEPVITFDPLERALDARVDQPITLTVERDSERHDVSVTVGDLQELSPREFVEFGGAIFHPVSYQIARHYDIPIRGIYVAEDGEALDRDNIPRRAIVTSIDKKPVETLDELWAMLPAIVAKERVRVEYHMPWRAKRKQIASIHPEPSWFLTRRCARAENVGTWQCMSADGALTSAPRAAPEPVTSAASRRTFKDPAARALAPSLVMVESWMPHGVEGRKATSLRGTGLIVDAKRGLVITDRDTIPTAMVDVSLTFEASYRIPARVELVHPRHNLALISYDPSLVQQLRPRGATLRAEPLEVGDDVWQITLGRQQKVRALKTSISRIVSPSFDTPSTPAFRQTNAELIEVQDSFSSLGGVLADRRGRVRALWLSFYDAKESKRHTWGLSARLATTMLQGFERKEGFVYRTLGAEFSPITLAKARDLGLPEEWIGKLAASRSGDREALIATRFYEALGSSLRSGDILLAINDEVVTRYLDLDRLSQSPNVEVDVWRGDHVERLIIEPTVLDDRGLDRMVAWAGLNLHEPRLELVTEQDEPREGVYVALWHSGSPAARFGVRAARRLVRVNRTPIADLDSFLAAVAPLKDGDTVRLELVDMNGQREFKALRLDMVHWPTREFRRTEDGWAITAHGD